MKKINLGILSLALAAGFTLVSCGEKPNTGTQNNPTQQNDSKKDMGSVIKTKQDVYAYSMFSSSTLLDNLSPMSTGLASLTEADKQAEIDKVDEYVKMFDGLLANKGINQTTEKNDNPDFAEYETKMTVVQQGKTYVSYLNETAVKEEDKGKEDSEEVEVETKLSGLMFEMDANNSPVASYIIDGKKEVSKEVEGSETEEELEIMMTSYLAEKNAEGKYEKVVDAKSVTVKQEFETEVKEDGTIEKEQSFKYIVKDKDGKKVPEECSKVSIEEENGETEIKLSVGAEQGKKMYKFNKVGDVLDIKVIEGKQQPTLQITVTFVKDAEGNVTTNYEFKECNKNQENKA